MKLHIISTGSKGNAYILGNNKECILLECGMKLIEVKKALDFNLSTIKFCLLTHSHGDHAKYAKEYADAGIQIYTSKETIDAINVQDHHNFKAVTEKQMTIVGGWRFIPYNIQHDCPQGFCYLINHPGCGNTLFLTDSFYIPYKFTNLNNLIIEANYCENILAEREKIHPFLRDRIITSHMSLQTCKEMLSANDLSAVNNIVLIHLSDSNSNAALFQKEISELTRKKTTVADNGMVIEMSKLGF